MLNSMRSSKSNVFVWIIIGLLIVALVGFGIGGSGGGTAQTAVASVGDTDVTVDEYARALSDEQRRIAQQVGRQFSIQELRAFGIDQQVIGRLLGVAAIENEAERLGLSVGDATVRDALMRTPAFVGPDGRFDQTAYNFALENANLDPREYDEILRGDTTRRLIELAIAQGVSIPDTAVTATVQFIGQKRAVSWVRLSDRDLPAPITPPTDAQLQEYFDANPESYTLPETRKLTYAYVTEGMLAARHNPSNEEIRKIYDERIDEFSAPARRILDRLVYPDADSAAEAVRQIAAGDISFDEAAAARGLSPDDTDIGEVTAAELDQSARDLIFGSEELGVFGPVTTLLGPTIYRVNAVLDATVVTVEEARDEIADELAREAAAEEIINAYADIQDLVAGGASLEELATDTILELDQMELTSDTRDGLAADENFREEAFAADIGQERDPVELSDGLLVLRVDEIVPPRLQDLEEVKSAVALAWTEAETARVLSDLANGLAARIAGGEDISDIAAEYELLLNEEDPLGRNDIVEDTPPGFITEIFKTDEGAAAVVTDEATVLLAVVTEYVPIDPDSDEAMQPTELFGRELSSATANDVFTYFTLGIQDEAGISVNQSLIANIQSQLATGYSGQ